MSARRGSAALPVQFLPCPMWRIVLEGLLSGIVAAASVGIVDLVEYVAFNPAVFHIHNFPDIVPDLQRGKLAAFWSGWRVSWFIYVPERVLLACFGTRIPAMLHLYFPTLCLLLMAYDRITSRRVERDVFYYHEWFYTFGAAVEVGWIIAAVVRIIGHA